MARGLAVATLLLVALAAVARPFAHAAKEYPADAAAESPAGKADVPAAAKESPTGKADAPAADKESSAGKADASAAAAEYPAGNAEAAAAAKEYPAGKADAPVAGPSGEGLEYVQFVIKNPVKSKDKSGGRDDGLPIDPTPDGQLQ